MAAQFGLYCREGSIIADYDVVYDLVTVAQGLSEVIDYINDTAIPILSKQTICGQPVDPTYLHETVQKELQNQGKLNTHFQVPLG